MTNPKRVKKIVKFINESNFEGTPNKYPVYGLLALSVGLPAVIWGTGILIFIGVVISVLGFAAVALWFTRGYL